MTNEINNKIAELATKMQAECVKFRQPRLNQINKNIDTYLNVEQPTLKGFSNVPLDYVVMSGYVETLMAKIDDAPNIKFIEQSQADLKKALKYTALWQRDSTDSQKRWTNVDRNEKKLAIFQGIGISKIYTESPYKAHYDAIPLSSFLFEPSGGDDLETHKFVGQEDIYKSWEELKQGVKDRIYDNKQVEKLKQATDDTSFEKNDDLYKNKYRWQKSLGLDVESTAFSGEALYNLTEMILLYNGERYYIVFDYSTGTWIRIEKLKDVFASGLYPWTVWQTDNNLQSLLCKSPADVIRPIAVSMKEVFNRGMDNLNKTTHNMRGVDLNMIPNLNQLNWRHNGIVGVKTLGTNKSAKDAFFDIFPPERTNLIVNLTDWLNNFLGQQTGITASAQGASDKDTKVGVYYGDLQQVADRLGLLNKSYSDAWRAKTLRWQYGVDENLSKPEAIKIIGDKGAEWEEITVEDKNKNKEFDVEISSGRLEAEFNEVKQRRRIEALDKLIVNPLLVNKLNPNKVIEEQLINGGYDDSDVKQFQDLSEYGDRIIVSEAHEENEKMLAGKEVKPNKGATASHLQVHQDFATDTDLKLEVFNQIMLHIDSEIHFAEENENKRADEMSRSQNIEGAGQEQPVNRPIANTASDTQSRSQTANNLNR